MVTWTPLGRCLLTSSSVRPAQSIPNVTSPMWKRCALGGNLGWTRRGREKKQRVGPVTPQGEGKGEPIEGSLLVMASRAARRVAGPVLRRPNQPELVR